MKTIIVAIAVLPFLSEYIMNGQANSHTQHDIKIGLITSDDGDGFYTSAVSKAIDVINQKGPAFGNSRVDLIKHTDISPDAYILSSTVCSLISSGAIALLTKTSCQVDEQIKSLPFINQIPVIPLRHGKCDGFRDENSTNVPLESGPLLSHVISSIVLAEGWDEIQIFYDESYGKHVNWIMDYLSTRQLQLTLYNIEVRNITAMMEIKNLFQNNDYFIVMASFTKTAWLLTQARITDLDILGPKYQWLIAHEGDIGRDSLLGLLKEGDNVAFMAEEEATIDSQVNCTLMWLLGELDQGKSSGLWINDTKPCHKESLKVPHSLEQFITRLQQSPRPKTEAIVLIYTLAVHPQSGIFWDEIGSWTSSTGLDINGYLFPDVHRGFNNRTFLITTVNYPPFMIRWANNSYGGICFDLLSELQATLNFSYKIIEPESQEFGTRLPTGNFTGMMKLIQRKEVEFAVAIMGVNAERKAVADFTTPFMADPTIILMRKPDLATSQVFICLGPFNYQVWFLIALSVIVVGAILWLLVWVHPLHTPRLLKELKEVGIYDPKINIWQIFGALMQQGMVHIPESHSARILISAWWFYTIVVVGTYNGNLIAFLTAPKVNTPVNSLSELAHSGMKFGFARGTMLHGVFQNADKGVFKDLWDTIKHNKEEYIVQENSEGMELALGRPDYAFLLEKSFYDTLGNKELHFRNESCKFARAKESFLNMFYAFPFQKGSPYVRKFDKVIMRILEAGLLEKWHRKWYAAVHRCTGLERTKEQSNISLAEAQGAFYILAIGLFVATLILASEKLWTKTTRESLPKQNPYRETNGVYRNGSVNGSVYHVGRMPPIVKVVNLARTPKSDIKQTRAREISRTEEIELQYGRVKFSPYPAINEGKKVKRSRSFPLMFSSCCRGSDPVNSENGSWEMTERNASLADGIHATPQILSQAGNPTVSLLFNFSPAVAWYDKTGKLPSSPLSASNGSLGRRWHSDVGFYMDGRFVKDAETGEYLKTKGKRS